MQHLNSVLLEGTVNGSVTRSFDPDTGAALVIFDFTSQRVYRENGLTKHSTLTMPVKMTGTLADRATSDILYPNRGLRLVGRLAWTQVLGLHLFAEHVEYKPERTTT